MKMSKTLCGIDRIDDYMGFLRGKRLALMTNQSAVDADFNLSLDILNEKLSLKRLFAVEHGIRGNVQAGERVESFTDSKTGLPVISLYGDKKAPSADDLSGLDAVIFDIQDVGLRFYTFLYSLSYLMQACADNGVSLLVLDRPNPLSGNRLEGCILEPEFHSFVGEFPMPTRYALTIGEYALFVKKHLNLSLDLRIAELKNWDRHSYFDESGRIFIPPSPNLPSLDVVLCYVGTCIFEGTNISEGRGTALPFQIIGAPFINAGELSQSMNSKGFSGVKFRPCYFTPSFSKHEGKPCQGVQIHVTDRYNAELFYVGLSLLEEIRGLYPDNLEFLKSDKAEITFFDKLLGTNEFRLGKITAEELFLREAKKLEGFFKSCERLY